MTFCLQNRHATKLRYILLYGYGEIGRHVGFRIQSLRVQVPLSVNFNKIIFIHIYLIMPQLDNVTYLSQIFWTFLTFSSIYFILLKKILPHIAKVFKLRIKLINYYKGLFNDINSLNNNYILDKSNDIIQIFTLNNKKVIEYNNGINSLSNDLFLQNYLRNYPLLSILIKIPKVLISK